MDRGSLKKKITEQEIRYPIQKTRFQRFQGSSQGWLGTLRGSSSRRRLSSTEGRRHIQRPSWRAVVLEMPGQVSSGSHAVWYPLFRKLRCRSGRRAIKSPVYTTAVDESTSCILDRARLIWRSFVDRFRSNGAAFIAGRSGRQEVCASNCSS